MQLPQTLGDKLYSAWRLFLRPPGPRRRLLQFRQYRSEVKRGGGAGNFDIRVPVVCSAADNAKIPRAEHAGEIVNGALIMHNGNRVLPGSYMGEDMTRLLEANRGVHEPQEELAFGEVLRRLQAKNAASYTMLELGSYWAFYSLWFKIALSGSECFCVEPDPQNLESGRKNFHFNSLAADFTQAYVGAAAKTGEPPTISVDSLMREKGINHLHILHSDIQGYELQMLSGATEAFARGAVDYIFISTHSHFLHYRCLDALKNAGFRILGDVDLLETNSVDGVIVAARAGLKDQPAIPLTPRRYAR